MIDAYRLQQRLLSLWQNKSVIPSGTSVTRNYPEVPVYVNYNGELILVTNITEDQDKIVLEIK